MCVCVERHLQQSAAAAAHCLLQAPPCPQMTPGRSEAAVSPTGIQTELAAAGVSSARLCLKKDLQTLFRLQDETQEAEIDAFLLADLTSDEREKRGLTGGRWCLENTRSPWIRMLFECLFVDARRTQKLVVLHSCSSVHAGLVCAEPRLIIVVRHTSSGATDFHTQLSFVGSSHWGGFELDSVFPVSCIYSQIS